MKLLVCYYLYSKPSGKRRLEAHKRNYMPRLKRLREKEMMMNMRNRYRKLLENQSYIHSS